MSPTIPPPSWGGVFPALTTQFQRDGSLDREAIRKHFAWQISCGVDGLVVNGSLGENGSLEPEEKLEVVKLAVGVSGGTVPVLSGVAESSTARACRFVEQASRLGLSGFMVLPPMQYVSDRRETIAHLRAVAASTDLPIMLYNNPVAYRVDITPEMFAELADEPRFVAIKESSENVRRLTDIRNLLGVRYRLFVGVDDLAMESVVLGADGWVAGLVCAFPRESVALFRLVRAGRIEEALPLYRWFMPLLHLDASVKFVQNIKLVESLVGAGVECVRPPRLPLTGEERNQVEEIVRHALAARPVLPDIGFLTR